MTNVFEDGHKRVSRLEHFAFGLMELVVLDGGKDTGSPKELGELGTDDKLLEGDVNPMIVQPSGV